MLICAIEISLLNITFILDDVPFGLWSVVVKLLCDDDPLVRDQMASSLSMLLKRIQTSKTGMFRVTEKLLKRPRRQIRTIKPFETN